MSVRIEFYGIARRRAGVASIEVDAGRLGEALREAGRLLPEFAAACLDDCSSPAGHAGHVESHRPAGGHVSQAGGTHGSRSRATGQEPVATLKAGFIANLDGRSFTTDPDTPLSPGEAVLILSADAGG